MKKNIKEIIISLCVLLVIFLLLIPIFNLINTRRQNIIDSNKTTKKIKDLELTVNELPRLTIVDDDKAKEKIEATIISLKNNTDKDLEYNLYLFVDITSTVDINYLRISLNDTIYKPEYLEIIKNDKGYYLKLLSSTIHAYSELPLDARIWLSLDAREMVDENSKIITNFVTDINVD